MQLVLSKWPIFAEFRSMSSEIRGRKKKKERKNESLVEHKSADNYIGRPNYYYYYSNYVCAVANTGLCVGT